MASAHCARISPESSIILVVEPSGLQVDRLPVSASQRWCYFNFNAARRLRLGAPTPLWEPAR
jgi:hypothetical protein